MNKKNNLFFLFMMFISFNLFADCQALKAEKVIGCLNVSILKKLSVAIHDGDDGISLSLINNSKIVSSIKGLGYTPENFIYLEKKYPFTIITNEFNESVVAIRVKGDTTSLLSFYAVKDDKLILIPINDVTDKKDFIVTNYGSVVRIDNQSIKIIDPKYTALYFFEKNEIKNQNYKTK